MRTEEERARLQAIREHHQRSRASLEQLRASGVKIMTLGEYLAQCKAERKGDKPRAGGD